VHQEKALHGQKDRITRQASAWQDALSMLSVVLNEEVVEWEQSHVSDLAQPSAHISPSASQQAALYDFVLDLQCAAHRDGIGSTDPRPVLHADLHASRELATSSLPGQLKLCLQGTTATVTLDSVTMQTMMNAALLCNKPHTALLIFQTLVRHHVRPTVAAVNLVLNALAVLGEWLMAWQVLRSSFCGVGIDLESADIVMSLLHRVCAVMNEQSPSLVPYIHQIMDETFLLRRAVQSGSCAIHSPDHG
jgi:hypothetical protein